MADTSDRGFASMDPKQQKEIASKGGKASHESGKAHEFTPEEAAEAGRKGGEARAEHQSGGGQKDQSKSGGQSQRGGSSEQHAQAGRQSHKNS